MSDKYLDILHRFWGYPDFRGIQRNIIESIGTGHDTLGLMPTGGGKSIAFQVPAMAAEGVCLVITPLVALMKDQVINLTKRNIKAAAIHAGLTHAQVVTILENAIFGGIKILYVSPERLASEFFQTKIRHAKISFITVDEAHCISQWGYDFRPSYLQIAEIRKILPDVPVLALTATATPDVVDDIQERLGFKEKRVFKMSFERRNISYIVRRTEDKQYDLLRILEETGGSAIVYVRSRQKAKDISEFISQNGLASTYFHAGLENADKDKRQNEWLCDKTRIIVATNAFGMGIDKPDVRTVVHIDCPDSLEAYFQEAGRAGRDGQPAKAILLYNGTDERSLKRRITDNFPEKDYIRTVYDHLAYYYQIAVGSGYQRKFEFSPDTFCNNFRHYPIRLHSALKILERSGYIEYFEEEENRSRLVFTLERDELYRLTNNTPEENRVIVALLRLYAGLFVDFCFIDESYISAECGLESNHVYAILKGMAQKNLIRFIPRKSTPYIKYTQRREESRLLVFPKEAYDDLKERYIKRIDAIYAYAASDGICRSRHLLAYFGEDTARDCGQCDVCKPKEKRITDDNIERVKKTILELLADGRHHGIHEVKSLRLDTDTLSMALRDLLDEEVIHQKDGAIYKAKFTP